MDKVIIMKDYKRNASVEFDSDMSCDECTETFQDLVYLAEKEDRLIKGIFESAHVLEMCPEIVEICILPSGTSQNIATHLQHKLIAAYCWENEIQIVELGQTDFNKTIKLPRNKSTESAYIECVLVTSKNLQDALKDDTDENFG